MDGQRRDRARGRDWYQKNALNVLLQGSSVTRVDSNIFLSISTLVREREQPRYLLAWKEDNPLRLA